MKDRVSPSPIPCHQSGPQCPRDISGSYLEQYYACQFVQRCRQCTVRVFPDGFVALDVVQYVGDNNNSYHIWTKDVSC